MSSYGPVGPGDPGPLPGGVGPYPPVPPAPAPQPDAWQDETVRYQTPAAPQAPAPQYPAPQSLGPQYPAPQSPGPQYPAPQSPAPQYPAPQSPGPQYPAPQSPAPQYPAQPTPLAPQAGQGQYPPPGQPYPGQPPYQQPQYPQQPNYGAPAPYSPAPVSPAQPPPAQPQGGPQQYDYYGNPVPVYQPGSAAPGAVGQAPSYDGGYQQEYSGDWQGGQGRKRSPAVLILSVVLVLLVAGAVVGGVLIYNRNKGGVIGPIPPPTVGQCVVSNNEKPPKALTMRVVNCGAGTYLVDQVFKGSSDAQKCKGVPSATNNYTYTWPNGTSDNYVLCLTLQK